MGNAEWKQRVKAIENTVDAEEGTCMAQFLAGFRIGKEPKFLITCFHFVCKDKEYVEEEVTLMPK